MTIQPMSCKAKLKTTMITATSYSAGNEITPIHLLKLTKLDFY